MWQKCVISIVIFYTIFYLAKYFSFLFVNVQQSLLTISYSGVESEQYTSDDYINLGFSLFEFEQAKLKEKELEYKYDLTAVLLHWKRLSGIKKILKIILDTNLFKKVIIWNNNPNINLTLDQLISNNRSSAKLIRIINSKKNLKDEAKYRACASSKTRACFYVDDDWNTSHYMKSLTASFRSDPNVLHSITDSYTFYTNLIWSYFDDKTDLHTGLTWISYGSIFLREHAQRFLQLRDQFLTEDLVLGHLADTLFSIWLGGIPSQIYIDIPSQSSSYSKQNLSFSSMPHFTHFQYNSSMVAIRLLEHPLRDHQSNKSTIIFPRKQNRPVSYYIKSPSFDDDFIFYSNVLPVHIQNISCNFDQETCRNLSLDSHIKQFISHNTWKAVDEDPSTCWKTNRPIRPDDFFAIDFLSAQTNIIFTLTISHSRALQARLEISISFDGIWWIAYRSFRGIFIKTSKFTQQTYLFNSVQFARGFESFRYIKFKAIQNSDYLFHVCDIHIVSKENLETDFQPLSI